MISQLSTYLCIDFGAAWDLLMLSRIGHMAIFLEYSPGDDSHQRSSVSIAIESLLLRIMSNVCFFIL